ncbi:fumarate reductase/succinate dehydrogenase flavoprotein subunit [Gleimia europaea]|uniref:succinate dehydrogenase n=1 Tax=Gleimia europaea ACS-120-V-Col10b TaxID=883069 RepID=A0A9W5RCX5_9ACTO|nr:fumarate reductase/succinate dehydrogenase flavoprotein subunit [Gleimia europaea]EPD29382.1 succinate dehydrogenase or fumarate reductase, flavoprotein subunit [Gleimia europaea ACS-120-V-Col10b]
MTILRGNILDGHVPQASDPASRWDEHKQHMRLVSPSNRRKFRVLVVGTGLAGAGAASTLAELGYNVTAVTYHDSPRRAHSVAAQGGINAARGKRVDGDGLLRFVTDTIKGGDFRAREAEAWRLAEESNRVIDHLSAHGVPFAREYDGALSNRSFGGVQVSRTFYSRGQTGQQLQIAAHQSLLRQVAAGRVELWIRHEMLDLIVEDGRAVGVVVRNLITGELTCLMADAVVLATGGYGNVYKYSTLAKNSNATAAWRAHRRGAAIANTSFIQFHPTALPVENEWQSKTTLMSESLRNDGRIWVPSKAGDERPANEIPEGERDYYLERKYPAFGNLTPRDVASRAAREQIISGHGVGPNKNAVNLDFSDAIARLGKDVLNERYGNLFDMYFDVTGEDPRETPMRIAPGAHFTMGGLWVDYNLMSTIPGLFVAGEASYAYHGANRLGANSLLSACVDGFFVIPNVVPNYLATLLGTPRPDANSETALFTLSEVKSRILKLRAATGSTPAIDIHAELGKIMYAHCGVSRSKEGLEQGIEKVGDLRRNYLQDLHVTGSQAKLNQDLEQALRVQDYLELAQTMCVDAWHREESCGAHFREEYSFEGEAVRNDEQWMHTTAWRTKHWDSDPVFIEDREPLHFEAVQPVTRSYK